MSETSERSFLARLWFGFWGVVDGLRRIVLNILFLLLLAIVVVWLTQDKKVKPVDNKTTLVLQPRGIVVEQYSGSPIDRAIGNATGNQEFETRLRDLVKALELAQTDSKITQLLIDVRQMWSIGLASLEELELAIDEFKASGKPVYAIGSFMDQKQYHLASNADEVLLEDDGMIWLDGFATYRNYYAEALEKLSVSINLFRVGEFKSAMEPYIRTDMSPAARRANRFLLNGLWQGYLESIARHRGIPVAVLDQTINEYPELIRRNQGDTASTALDAGLIDSIVSRPALRTLLGQSDSGSTDNNGDLRKINHSAYLSRNKKASQTAKTNKVAVIVAEGEIVGGTAEPGMVGAVSLSEQLRRARRDSSVKAVVLRVNSPGGDASASEVIRQEMLYLQENNKPVIISMGDVAASGGYWIAMGADEIWAGDSTITGSIGIYGILPTFQNSLAELGIYTDGVGTTDRAGGLRIDRELHPDISSILQSRTNSGYQRFIELVSQYRQMPVDEVDVIAQGRVWTGQQALGHKLVDQLGGLKAATAAAARYADLGDDYKVEYVTRPLGAWEQFVVGLTSKALASLDVSSTGLANLPIGRQTPWWLAGLPRSIQQSIGKALVPLTRHYEQPTLFAHCLCDSP